MFRLHYDLDVPHPNATLSCSYCINCKGFTHLMKLVLMAEYPGAIDLVREIIANKPEEIDKQNEIGWTALTLACVNSSTWSNISIVKMLLDARANPNIPCMDGYTALIHASSRSTFTSNLATVKMLLEAGADPNLCNRLGETALMRASFNSTNTSDIQTVKLLLDTGSDPNIQNIHGFTALMLVAKYSDDISDLQTVRLLLEANTDPNLRNKKDRIALYYLLKYGNLDDVELLERLIFASQMNIPGDGSFYKHYLQRNVNVLDDHMIRILKGEIVMNKTKSARN